MLSQQTLVLLTLRELEVMHVRVERERRGRDERYQPYRRDDADGSPQPGHRVRQQRVADGQIALQTERHDYQHRHVGRPGTWTDTCEGVRWGS